MTSKTILALVVVGVILTFAIAVVFFNFVTSNLGSFNSFTSIGSSDFVPNVNAFDSLELNPFVYKNPFS